MTRKQSIGKKNWSYTGLFHTPEIQGHQLLRYPQEQVPQWAIYWLQKALTFFSEKQNKQKIHSKKKMEVIQTAARNSFIYAFYSPIFYIIQGLQHYRKSSSLSFLPLIQTILIYSKGLSSLSEWTRTKFLFPNNFLNFYYHFLSGNLFNLCSSNTNSWLLKGNDLTIAEAHRKDYW